jgi:hypothetical protein
LRSAITVPVRRSRRLTVSGDGRRRGGVDHSPTPRRSRASYVGRFAGIMSVCHYSIRPSRGRSSLGCVNAGCTTTPPRTQPSPLERAVTWCPALPRMRLGAPSRRNACRVSTDPTRWVKPLCDPVTPAYDARVKQRPLGKLPSCTRCAAGCSPGPRCRRM